MLKFICSVSSALSCEGLTVVLREAQGGSCEEEREGAGWAPGTGDSARVEGDDGRGEG